MLSKIRWTCFAGLLFPFWVIAQKEDYHWIMGVIRHNGASDTSKYSPFDLDFGKNPPAFSLIKTPTYALFLTNAAISGSSGNLLYYTNGVVIKDSLCHTIENGGDLQDSSSYLAGYAMAQGALFLPYPGAKDSIILLLSDRLSFLWWGDNQYHGGGYPTSMSIIDKSANNGAGKVVVKQQVFLPDTLVGGQLTACRHGNGRDWWVLLNEYGTPNYYRVLVSPKGVDVIGKQSVGIAASRGLGQAVFSPDGNWFARYNALYSDEPNWVDIYRFDRCAGLLSDHIQFSLDTIGKPGGIAISPNSRYLYVAAWDTIHQYDLLAPDIVGSNQVVAAYDGFLDTALGGVQPKTTRFYTMQLAPDNKIYITIPNVVSKRLHVIDQPDIGGVGCNVLQHSFHLPKQNTNSIPNFPFFRLWDWKDSPCDTLGINTSVSRPESPPAGFSIFPNPTTHDFTLHFPENLPSQATILNLAGQPIQKMSFQKGETSRLISTENWPPGLYFIKADWPTGQSAVQKLVIIH